MTGPMAANPNSARGLPPSSPSPSSTSTTTPQTIQPRRSRPSQLLTNLPSQSPLAVPPSAISNSSVASSFLHDSPFMSPDQGLSTTNNSSMHTSPDGLRGRDVEQFQPAPLHLGESLISRKTSTNSLGQSTMSSASPFASDFPSGNNNKGGGVLRRLSKRLPSLRRQSSANPNSRDGSIGPAILRRRSDSNSTAPPEYGGNAMYTDSDEDPVDEKDDVTSTFGCDGVSIDLSPMSGTASTIGSSAPTALATAGPVVPLSLLKGTSITKVSKKNSRKRITLVLDSDSAKIFWDRNRPSKCVYIDDIKEIRTGEDIGQYRRDFGISKSEECLFFSILYALPDKSRNNKTMHLIADDEDTFLNWTMTLDAISKHRQELMTSLMAFNDKAIRAYWHGEMAKKFGDKPHFPNEELIDFPGVERVCRNLHIHVSSQTLQTKFREAKSTKLDSNGAIKVDNKDAERLDFVEFQEFVRLMKTRDDIRPTYVAIASNGEAGITCKEFLTFLREVQGEDVDDAAPWEAIFSRFSRKGKPRDATQPEGCEEEVPRMTEAALASFLTSMYNPPIAKEPRDYVLDRPMNEYFISSSHNTYLLGWQVKGVSSVEGYISALMRGCRCVEIDCWDGADGQPIVVHGRTMTSSISFREVINTVNKYAFVKSRFPLWISLEVHCNPAQQEIMVNIMKEVFKDKLVTEPLASSVDRLPSPSELKDRILVKAKKPQSTAESKTPEAGRKRGNSQPSPYLRPVLGGDMPAIPTQTVPSSPVLSPSGAMFSPRVNRVGTMPRVREGEVHEPTSSSPSECESDSDKDPSKRSTNKITKILGSLAVYSVGIKFNGFDGADAKTFNHILSFKETTFAKNSHPQEKKRALYRHNMRFMMRVYPNQTRFSSSNFDPLMYWKRGVQMCALNWQTFDLGMQLNQAMFDGGTDQSGYVLKTPEFREIQVVPNPPLEWVGKRERKNVNFSIDVISAQQLMRPSNLGERRTVDPYVEVEVFVPDDKRSKLQPSPNAQHALDTPLKYRTQIVKDNGFNPRFEKTFNFSVTTKYPALVFVRWSVRLSGMEPPLATFTAKLSSLKQGYRTLPLLNHNGDRYLFSTLFCQIKVEPITSILVPYPEDGAENSNKFKTLGGRVFNRSSNMSPKSSLDSGLS